MTPLRGHEHGTGVPSMTAPSPTARTLARLRAWLTLWWHLTPSAKTSALWIPLRCHIVPPAPAHYRCFMGAPVDPTVHCPRRAVEGEMFCARHLP